MKRPFIVLAAWVAASGMARAQTPAAPVVPQTVPASPPAVPATGPAPADAAPPVPAVSLRDVLRHAQSDPPSVLAAAAAVERTDALQSQAEMAWLPSLSAQVVGGLTYENRIVLPTYPRIDTQSLMTQANAQVDWTALNLARGRNIDAARAAVQAQGAGKEAAQRTAMVLAAEMYVRAQAATELVKDAQLTVERRTSQHEGILALTRTGLKQPIDAQRAEVEAVSARYVLEGRKEEEVAAWASLAATMGRSPMSPVRPAGPVGDALEVVLPPGTARELALRNRPEKKQAEAIVVQRDAEHGTATMSRLPTAGVLANGTIGYLERLKDNNPYSVSGSQYSANALVYLRWAGLDPIVWSRASVAEAAALESRRQLDATSLALASEAVQSAHAVNRARTERDRTVAVLSAAQVTREAQNGRYRAGLASLLELLDAENLEQEARRRRIEADRDFQIAGARLLASCGLLNRLTR